MGNIPKRHRNANFLDLPCNCKAGAGYRGQQERLASWNFNIFLAFLFQERTMCCCHLVPPRFYQFPKWPYCSQTVMNRGCHRACCGWTDMDRGRA